MWTTTQLLSHAKVYVCVCVCWGTGKSLVLEEKNTAMVQFIMLVFYQGFTLHKKNILSFYRFWLLYTIRLQ